MFLIDDAENTFAKYIRALQTNKFLFIACVQHLLEIFLKKHNFCEIFWVVIVFSSLCVLRQLEIFLGSKSFVNSSGLLLYSQVVEAETKTNFCSDLQ